jgi:flagellin-like hook-associated protein FlgL
VTDTTPIVEPDDAPSAAESSGSTVQKAVLAVALVVAIASFGWALTMRADLQDRQDEVSELTAQNAALRAESSAAGSARSDELAQADSDVQQAIEALGLTRAELDVKENQVRAATTALPDAARAAQRAQGRLEEAEAQRDLFELQTRVATLCAQGGLSAFGSSYAESDLPASAAAALSELEKAADACQAAGEF